MENPNSNAMIEQLEPAVVAVMVPTITAMIEANRSTVNAETTAGIYSAAISLKRIADYLDPRNPDGVCNQLHEIDNSLCGSR